MSDLRSIGDHMADGKLPVNLISQVAEPSLIPQRTTSGSRSMIRSFSRRRMSVSCDSSVRDPSSAIQTQLAAIKAQRDAERAARLDERRTRWQADRQGWRGHCLACLDTGSDYLTQLDCSCPAGIAVAAERERTQLEHMRQFIAAKVRDVMAVAGIPAEYRDWTLENFPRRTRTLTTLTRWADEWNARDGLVLFGSYGTGKTSLMISLMRVLATHYLTGDPHGVIRARFKRASELLSDLRAAMDTKDESYDRLLTEAKQIRLFVLDDLGRENPKSEWVSETLFEIIDARYAHGLPIFATTNYTPETLPGRLGINAEAIMERINDRCVWIKVTGSSMRTSQARVLE